MFSSDVPIEKAEKDVLNRKSFAASLAKVMINHDSSEAFTIGLYGVWGSGKTSVINMVTETVEELNPDIIIVKFNPWLCSDSKQLVTQFFKQLSSAMKLKNHTWANAAASIDSYSELLELAGSIGPTSLILSTIAKVLGKRAKAYIDKNDGDLQKKKNEIVKVLSEQKQKIIVTIDDIDRLSEAEIVSVFQLIKSLADFPHTIYLLAFDYDVVVRALTKVQNGNGAEYLQKIVQVPFALPKANSEDVERVLFEKLNGILSDVQEGEWEDDTWARLYLQGIKPYIKTIRDAIRYTNTFTLKYELLKTETCVLDLLGLTCLQVFEPGLYDMLPLYKDVLCSNIAIEPVSDYRRERTDHINQVLNIICASAGDETKKYAEEVLKILFPRAFGNEFDNSRQRQQLRYVRKHISEPEMFFRYFSLSLAKDDIPSSLINNLVYDADKDAFSETIKAFSGSGNDVKLLEALNSYIVQASTTHVTMERAKVLFMYLVESWHQLSLKDPSTFVSIPPAWEFLFCIESLLDYICEEDRYPLLNAGFKNHDVDIVNIALILSELEKQHNRLPERNSINVKASVISLDNLIALEQQFLQRVQKEIEEGTLLRKESVSQALWLFSLIDQDSYKSYITRLIENDLQLALFIHQFVNHGRTTTMYNAYKTWDVDWRDIELCINLDIAYNRVSAFVQSEEFAVLPQNVKEDIAAFLVEKEKRDTQKNVMSWGANIQEIQGKLMQSPGER